MPGMRRREFVTLLGGAAAAWPLAARAQQPERMRRIGVLMHAPRTIREGQARLAAFLQGLQQLGWTDGRNVRIDTRWAAGDAERIRKYAAELVALAPDVILALAAPDRRTVANRRPAPCRSCSRVVTDPVGAGYVESLARPGGNATGFTAVRIRHEREMAGAAQADRAARDASGGPSGSRHSLRDRPVRRNPGGGAVARGGGEPGRCARRRRDRARHHGVCARPNGGLIVTASAVARFIAN